MAFWTIRPSSATDAFDLPLWETFFTSTIGLEVPVLSSLSAPRQPLAKCVCKKHALRPDAHVIVESTIPKSKVPGEGSKGARAVSIRRQALLPLLRKQLVQGPGTSCWSKGPAAANGCLHAPLRRKLGMISREGPAVGY
jgi:hypothetical protein